MTLQIDDPQLGCALGIDGLEFTPNNTRSLDPRHGWFSLKVSSSDGPLVSDFVTHQPGFEYGTNGIHVGQDDRLTFMGDNGGKQIIGYLTDCRQGSPTAGVVVTIAFRPSPHRRLIIPRGVAHSFDNLEYIVTRDEPVWYSDVDNPAWNVDNDLVSFARGTPPEQTPRVRANRFLLTPDAHLFISRLSQTLLLDPKAYLNRFQVHLGGDKQYVVLEATTWTDNEDEIAEHVERRWEIGGVQFTKNRFALTGKRSYTIVPNTTACVADIVMLEPSDESDVLFCHARTQKLYSFLNAEGARIQLTLFDARRDSKSAGKLEHVSFTADPRVHLVIPHGVAYRLSTPVPLVVRSEHVVFVDRAEPRTDIPMFNDDLILKRTAELEAGWRLSVPELSCPPELVYRFARMELDVNAAERSGSR